MEKINTYRTKCGATGYLVNQDYLINAYNAPSEFSGNVCNECEHSFNCPVCTAPYAYFVNGWERADEELIIMFGDEKAEKCQMSYMAIRGAKMKPLRRAAQRNVRVNISYYTLEELDNLLEIEGVFDLCRMIDTNINNHDYRVSLEDVNALRIELFHGYYVNVAVLKSGEKIIVEL